MCGGVISVLQRKTVAECGECGHSILLPYIIIIHDKNDPHLLCAICAYEKVRAYLDIWFKINPELHKSDTDEFRDERRKIHARALVNQAALI
jgi:hypothetical protein